MTGQPLARRALAEALGTGALVVAVVGSGIMAARLSPDDVGLQLLENAIATALALGVIIVVFGPVSGAHLNPVVSMVAWWSGLRRGGGLPGREVGVYVAAQTAGAVGGAVLANVMFDLPAVEFAATARAAGHLWISEIVATSGLILLIFALARTGRATLTPAAVGAYIGAAYWFTSSTSFANPAITVGRVFSDTFAGIAPASVVPFILAQLVGGAVALGLVRFLYPDLSAAEAGNAVEGRNR